MSHLESVEDATLRQLVMQIAGRSRRAWMAELEPLGLSPHLARALGVVKRSDPGTLRLSDLATRLNITPRSATEVADALAERGLVERQPSPTDRRATVLGLTGEGEAVWQRIAVVRDASGDALFAVLTDREQATLRALLAKVIEADGRE